MKCKYDLVYDSRNELDQLFTPCAFKFSNNLYLLKPSKTDTVQLRANINKEGNRVSDINPYQPPVKNLDPDQSVGYSDIKLLSSGGRIGRMRYIAYSVAYGLLLNIAVGLLTAVDIQSSGVTGGAIIAIGTLVVYLVFLVALVLLTIQRIHDFNASGWLSIIMLLPLINFALWFIPGTSTANDYGKPTPPNTIGVYVLALIIPIAMIGILASIAIPAYNDYIKAAQQAAG